VESGSWVRVLELASQYGYAFLFLVSVAENTFLLGLVVPGDVAVVIGGALSASGQLKPVTLTLVVVLGVLLGANLSFWIGRRGGIPLIERSAERFSIERSRMKQVEGYFQSHGAKTVFVASFVSGFKNLIPAVAGASRMGGVRFFSYNAAGSALRSVLLVAIGYVFGASFPRAVQIFGSVNVWILVVIVVAMVVLVAVRRRKRRRDELESGARGQDRVDRGTS
jgi:membrane protein DedA with SNARE-associated domain